MKTFNFKVGDKVKYDNNHYGDSEINPMWGGKYGKIKGVITSIQSCLVPALNIFLVDWSNGKQNSYYAKFLTHANSAGHPLTTIFKEFNEKD